jgi:hypothetical protein
MKMCSFYKIKEKILRMTLVNIQKILTNSSKRKIKEIKIRNRLDNLRGFWYDNNIKKEKKSESGRRRYRWERLKNS